MALPPIIRPTGTPREQLQPKAAGRWPNKNEQLKAAGKGGK